MACVMIDNGFRCTVCGATYNLVLPISIPDFAKKQKAFSELHKDCKKQNNQSNNNPTNG